MIESGIAYRELGRENGNEFDAAATLIALQELGDLNERQGVADILRGQSDVNLGAFAGNTLVGAVSINTNPRDQYDRGDAYLAFLVVDETHRNQRIGGTLLRLAEERTIASGVTGIWGLADDSADSSGRSQATFAERHGYQTFDTSDEPMAMRKDLR